MRRDFVIFHFENNKIDNAARRCLRNKTKPFYCETVLEDPEGSRPQTAPQKNVPYDTT